MSEGRGFNSRFGQSFFCPYFGLSSLTGANAHVEVGKNGISL